jgi:hypothetical protein
VRGRDSYLPLPRPGPATLPQSYLPPSRQEHPAEVAASGKEVKSG